MKHCNIFANQSQYDASIGDVRTTCKNNNDFETWDNMLPFLSIIDGGTTLKYTSYEFTVTVNGNDPYGEFGQRGFLTEGEPYQQNFDITVPRYYSFDPGLIIQMNGKNISSQCGISQPLPDRPSGSRDWQYVVDIPEVTGNITIWYNIPYFK